MVLLIAPIDPVVIFISILALLSVGVGIILKKVNQPYIIGYILIGIFLGQNGLDLITDTATIHQFGEIGIILLLFFIGMEISLPELVKKWKIAIIGTLLQVMLSVGIVSAIGYFLDWPIHRSIILGFVISLSSSAIIIKLLQDKKLIETTLGKNVLSILLTQDIIIVPLLIITSFMGGVKVPIIESVLMTIGGMIIIAILLFIYIKRTIRLPFSKQLESDHELQVFMALILCFGGAIITSLFGLSAALGAFVGGMVLHVSNAVSWIHDVLHSFRVLFVAFFFVSIGLQIDFTFISVNITAIIIVLFAVYVTNHFINSLILRLFASSWSEAFLGGAMLGQIGELSFLICFSAYTIGIIGTFGYKFAISLISLTLIISPFWISLSEGLVHYRNRKTRTSDKFINLRP